MLDRFGNAIEQFAYKTADSVPETIQFAIGFFLYPLYWASFVYLMTCIAVIGIVGGHLAVLKLTGSVLLAAVAIPALPAAAFSLWVFGTAWRKEFPRAAGVFTAVWTAILVIGGIGLLAGIDLGIFFT
jgi:hypothetical protein